MNFLVFTYLILLFHCLLWVYLLYFIAKVNRSSPIQTEQPVSVIICTHNAASQLKSNISSWLNQGVSSFEINIVDDHSTDETADLLCQYATQQPLLKWVEMQSDKSPGKKAALRRGIETAAHDLLLLTDADCRPGSQHWVAKMTANMDADHQMVAGYSPFFETKGLVNLFARFENMMTAFQMFGFARGGMPYMATGRNVAYTRGLLQSIDYFESHQHIASGDDDLTVQQALAHTSLSLTLDPDTFVYTDAAKDWTSYFRQKMRHMSVSVNYASWPKFVLTVFNGTWLLCYLLIGILLALGLIKAAIMALLIKWSVSVVVFSFLNKILKQQLSWIQMMMCDVVYPFIMTIVMIAGLFKKRTTWN